MTMYSHSRLGVFRTCPRQYFYGYVAKVKVEKGPTPWYFALGTAAHTALERLYRSAGNGRVMDLKEVVTEFDQAWQEEYDDTGIDFLKATTTAECRRTGAKVLRAYYEQHAPFNGARLIGLERKVFIDLNGDGRYKLVGHIDRLEQRHDGTYEIHDYKTGRDLPAQSELDGDRQLPLYQMGVTQSWTDAKRVELVWHYLRHEKEMRSICTPERLKALKRELIALIDGIESRGCDESRFETCEGKHCGGCNFQHLCPARKHLFKTADLPVNRFLKDSGVKLVNRYAKLTAEMKKLGEQVGELEAERDQVDEAILAYAQRKGLEIVVGSHHEAKVTESTEVGLPTRGETPEEYDKLDAKLRRSPAWPEVSTLDAHAVRRIWKGGQEDPGGVKRIVRPFVTEEAKRTVRIRKRKTE